MAASSLIRHRIGSCAPSTGELGLADRPLANVAERHVLQSESENNLEIRESIVRS